MGQALGQLFSNNETPSKDSHEDCSNRQENVIKGDETPSEYSLEDCCNTRKQATIKSDSDESPSKDSHKDCSEKREKTINIETTEEKMITQGGSKDKTMNSETTEEKMITQGGSNLIPVPVIKRVSASVCQLELPDGNATGFLGKFLCNNTLIYGLFTNNHVLNEKMLADCDKYVYLKFDFRKKKLRLRWKSTFRFTCPVLDVTFIHLEDTATQLHETFECKFLACDFNWMGKEEEQLLVVQNPQGCRDLQVASGSFYKKHGFDIFHKASTDYGSSGSPLVTLNGIVIGIHKKRAAENSDQYNVAVSTKAVLAAICHFKSLPRKLVSNPKSLDSKYEDQILEQNLRQVKENCKYGIIYQGSETHGSKIWFVPTSHGWYWTPTDPLKEKLDVNWMSVQSLKVTGDNYKPTEENIKIIKWLRKNNIVIL